MLATELLYPHGCPLTCLSHLWTAERNPIWHSVARTIEWGLLLTKIFHLICSNTLSFYTKTVETVFYHYTEETLVYSNLSFKIPKLCQVLCHIQQTIMFQFMRDDPQTRSLQKVRNLHTQRQLSWQTGREYGESTKSIHILEASELRKSPHEATYGATLDQNTLWNGF